MKNEIENRKKTDSNEWLERNVNDIVTVGITEHAVQLLGDIVYVELPIVGSFVNVGEEVVVLESSKAATESCSPLSGYIVEVNSELIENPYLMNDDPHYSGWLYKIKMSDQSQYDMLDDYFVTKDCDSENLVQ